MKNTLIRLLPLILLLFVSPQWILAQAADDDTCIESIIWMPKAGGPSAVSKMYLLLTCTADSGDGSLSYTLSTKLPDIDGKFVYSVDVANGDPAMSQDSDLAVTDGFGLPLITAAGNGLNLINSSTGAYPQVYMEGPNDDAYQLLYSDYPPTFTVTGNSVVSAIVKIRIPLLPL